MGNIFEDITEDINIKPSKSKLVIRWLVRISILLIAGAFTYGQIKTLKSNKMNDLEKAVIENTKAVQDLKSEMTDGFDNVNKRIDQVYDDGIQEFYSFQEYNRKQLILVIDYGATNKSLLKQMLEINSMEKSKSVQLNLEQSKFTKITTNPLDSISMHIVPMAKPKK